MASPYPQAEGVGRLAGVLLVICVCVAAFVIVVAMTSGTTRQEPAAIAAKAS